MRVLADEKWMTTLIMPPGRFMVQGARASARDEAFPARKVRGFAPCGERGGLPPGPRPGKMSTLPVDAAPVDLARQVRAVSQAGHGDPGRRQRKSRGVTRLTDVIGKPHPWWSGLLQIYRAESK